MSLNEQEDIGWIDVNEYLEYRLYVINERRKINNKRTNLTNREVHIKVNIETGYNQIGLTGKDF